MKCFNYINRIHDKSINDIYEWNLPHGILNLYKHTKNIIICHYPILHQCMNTRRGRANI